MTEAQGIHNIYARREAERADCLTINQAAPSQVKQALERAATHRAKAQGLEPADTFSKDEVWYVKMACLLGRLRHSH